MYFKYSLITLLLLFGCQESAEVRLEGKRQQALNGDTVAIWDMYWNDRDLKNIETNYRTKWTKVGFEKTNNSDFIWFIIRQYGAYTKDIATVNKAFEEINKANPKNEKVIRHYHSLKTRFKALNVSELDYYKPCLDTVNISGRPDFCKELKEENLKNYKNIETLKFMAKSLPDITIGEEAE